MPATSAIRSLIERKWIVELAGSALLIAVGASFLLLFYDRTANLLDEGSTVAMANRILLGEVIYRDFMTPVTPGSFYTVAWLFKLFGTDLMVVRWAVFAMSLGMLTVTLIVARRLMSWPFAAAAALLTLVWGWYLVAPNLYSWQAMLLALVALACFLRFDQTARTGWLAAAGLACGAAMLVKQNTGVYATVALLGTLWLSQLIDPRPTGVRDAARASLRLLGAVTVMLAPALAYLVWIGAGPHLYENWIYYPAQMYPRGLRFDYPAFYPLFPHPGLATIAQTLPALLMGQIRQPVSFEIWQKFVIYLPWVVYPLAFVAVSAHAVKHRRSPDPTAGSPTRAVLAVTMFGALTFLQAWPRADFTHILFAMTPAFVLLGYLSHLAWQWLVSLTGGAPTPLFRLTMALLVLWPQLALIRSGYNYTRLAYRPQDVPIRAERAGGILTGVRNADQIDQVTEYIHAHTSPGDPLFVVPWAAGFYFLADRPNPTRFDVLLPGDPDVYPCVIATLDETPPQYVIYGYAWDVDGKRFSDYAKPVDEYIRTRYELAERFDEYEIWRRRTGLQPVHRDVAAACKRQMLDAREFRRLLGN